MDKIKQVLSTINFDEPYDKDGHQDIYNRVHALSRSPGAAPAVPPSLVFYAARNILSPTFIVGQIPVLLNLLTSIETFRRFAMLKSDEALEWQKYYEREKTDGRAQDVRLLAAKEMRTLRRFLDKNGAQRREYILLVRSLIQLYIHYLWTAPESCLLGKRLNDFFPGSMNNLDMPSDLLFHIDLSEDEKVVFGRLRAECQDWVRTVTDWETTWRGEKCQHERLSEEEIEASFENDFHATFLQPSEPSEMKQNVEIYMNKVEEIMRKLEQWFPPSGM